MSQSPPRIRIRSASGHLLVRDGLNLTFYMRRDHADVASGVMHALDVYLRAVGPDALHLYTDEEGYWHELHDADWALIRNKLSHAHSASIHLADDSASEQRYRFRYRGMQLDAQFLAAKPGAVSAVSFWLPTEFLEEHGPGRVRELALELAAPLPFCSGHVGFSFNCDTGLMGVVREVRKLCFQYPGMDIPNLSRHSLQLGTRVRGPSWLTFLGEPVLGELSGAAGLRARLHSPDITVQELGSNRVVITLGPGPEAGDTERGRVLPAYRELARLLEPWLYHQKPLRDPDFPPEDMHRWERRFLD